MKTESNPIAAFLPTSAMAPIDAVIDMIDSVDRMVRMAGALIDARRPIELGGLEQIIGLLCARLLDLDYQDGRALRDRLRCLDRHLAGLEARLPVP